MMSPIGPLADMLSRFCDVWPRYLPLSDGTFPANPSPEGAGGIGTRSD
jgi:hypothetical protein